MNIVRIHFHKMNLKQPPMAKEKSIRKSADKKVAAKSLKEKRADKKLKNKERKSF